MQKTFEEQKEIIIRRWVVTITVSLGVILTITLFFYLRHNAEDTFRAVFLQRSISRAQSVAQELDRQIDRLDGLRRFMDSQESLERKTFSLYVKPLLEGVPVRALEWIPRVRWEDRLFYESSARQDDLEKFKIYEKDAQGNKVPVADRSEYFPVYYLEPLKGNEIALGFDMASDPVRYSAMEKSRDTGQTVVTEPLVLVQQGNKKTGVLVFMPVFAKDLPNQTIEQRQKYLKGFVLAVYNADELINGIYMKLPYEGLACQIEDLAAPMDRRLLYRYPPKEGSIEWNNPFLKYEMLFEMPDRTWRITIIPGKPFIDTTLSRTYWLVLPIGFILTTLVAVFLSFLTTARYRAENLVQLRTKELKKEKESLAKSEERFRQVAEETGEFIWEVDCNGLYNYVSPIVEKMFGYAPDEIIGKKYFYDFFPPQDKEKLMQESFSAFQKKEVFKDFFNLSIHRDGHEVLLLTNATPILDEKGDLAGYRGMDRDITAWKKAEEFAALNTQLMASEQQLKASNQQLKANEQQLKAANQQLKVNEKMLLKTQEELKRKIADLELFQEVTVGREITMVELKKEINQLLKELGKESKYEEIE